MNRWTFVDSMPSHVLLARRRKAMAANRLLNGRLRFGLPPFVWRSLKNQSLVLKPSNRGQTRRWSCWPKGSLRCSCYPVREVLNHPLLVFVLFLAHPLPRNNPTTPQRWLNSKHWLLRLLEKSMSFTYRNLANESICQRRCPHNPHLWPSLTNAFLQPTVSISTD